VNQSIVQNDSEKISSPFPFLESENYDPYFEYQGHNLATTDDTTKQPFVPIFIYFYPQKRKDCLWPVIAKGGEAIGIKRGVYRWGARDFLRSMLSFLSLEAGLQYLYWQRKSCQLYEHSPWFEDGTFQRSHGKIYFIQSEIGGPIKIGWAYVDGIQSRFETIQSMNPFRLKILATLEGNIQLEHKLHKRFASDRLHGEWFNSSPAIMSFIKRLEKDDKERDESTNFKN